jgi:hypothetical protein
MTQQNDNRNDISKVAPSETMTSTPSETMTQSTSTPTDLIFIATQIALSAKKLQDQIKKDKKHNPIDIPVKSLLGKIPTAKVFEADMPLVRIGKFENDDDKFFRQTLALYLSDDDVPGIYSPDLKTVDCEILTYIAGINGSVIIQKGNEQFIISFPISSHHRENLADLGKLEGEGIPPTELIKKVPHRMAFWEDLKISETYSIVAKTCPDDENFGTERYIIADSKGVQYEVYENASLRKIIDTYGLEEKFKIASITTKTETKKDHKTKKETKKETKKVNLVAVSSDFSDFSL